MTEKEINVQITRYIQGELSETEEDQLWVKFLEDPEYYRLFKTELNLYDLYHHKNFRINSVEDDSRVEEPGKQYHRSWKYLAAAAVFLIASSLYLFVLPGQPEYPALAMAEIELTEMLGSDVYRDQNSESSILNQAMNRAVSMAFNGEPDRAIHELSQFDQAELTNLQRVRILYNLGILYYNTDRLNRAEENFIGISADSSDDIPSYIPDSAHWYRANISLKRNDIGEARLQLAEISLGEGIHASKARLILDQLDESPE